MNDSGSQGGQVTLTASKGMGSRTEMGEIDPTTKKRLIHWNADMAEDGKAYERIYVGSSQNPSVSGVLYLNPSSLEGDPTTGTFTGYVFGDPAKLDYSVYPVPENGIIDLTTRTGKYVDAPMIGEIKSGNVQFENTCAIREVNIPGITGQDFELSAKADNETLKLGATAVVKFDASNKPYLDFTSTGNVVKVNNVPNDVFYVPFEITKNTKANVTFSGKASKQTTSIDITEAMDLSTAKPGVLAESGAKELHCVNGEIVQPTHKTANDFVSKTPTTSEGEEQNGVPTYTMNENENSTNLTTIPSNENVAVEIKTSEEASSTNPDEKVLSIAEVPTTVNTLIFTETITETPNDGDDNEGNEPEQPTPTEAKQKVTIALPETAENKTIDFNMPNSTVNVQSKSGEDLTINKVTASTADNTFIIGSGVTISELIAMKGAIEVSGEVVAIAKGSDNHYGNDKVKVKVKKGGKIPSNIDKNDFEVVYEDGDVPPVVEPEEPEILEEYRATNVLGFEAFMEALNKNAKHTYIELGDGMAIEAPIVIEEGREVEINMNGKYMVLIEQFYERYSPEAVIVNYGNLTISNGTINGHSNGNFVDSYLIKSEKNNLMLQRVNVQAHQIENGIYIKDGEFHLNDGSSVAAEEYAIYLEANDYCDADIWTGTVNGDVYWALNTGDYSKLQCRFGVGPSSMINGNLTMGGSYGVKATGYHLVKEATARVEGQGWNFNEFVGDKPNPPVSEFEHHVTNFAELQKVVETMQPVFDDYGKEQQHIIYYEGEGDLVITEPVKFRHPVHLGLNDKKVIVDMNNSTDEIMAVFETTDKSLRITNGVLECPSDQTNIPHFIYAQNFQENNYCEVVLHNVKMELSAVMNAVFAQNMFVQITDNRNISSIITPLNGDSYLERGRVLDISYTGLYKEDRMLEISIPGTLQGDIYLDAQHLNEGDATKYFKFENGQIVGNLSAEEYLFDNIYMLDTVTTDGYGWENITKVKTPNTGGNDFEKGGIW